MPGYGCNGWDGGSQGPLLWPLLSWNFTPLPCWWYSSVYHYCQRSHQSNCKSHFASLIHQYGGKNGTFVLKYQTEFSSVPLYFFQQWCCTDLRHQSCRTMSPVMSVFLCITPGALPTVYVHAPQLHARVLVISHLDLWSGLQPAEKGTCCTAFHLSPLVPINIESSMILYKAPTRRAPTNLNSLPPSYSPCMNTHQHTGNGKYNDECQENIPSLIELLKCEQREKYPTNGQSGDITGM